MLRFARIAALLSAALTLAPLASADPEPPTDEAPARAPHPEPRVIVTVSSVHGPHARDEVERAARLGWGRIVRCYKASPKRPRGSVKLELTLGAHGKVTGARRKKSTLREPELARCLTKALKGLAMPKARRRSTANVEVQVAPGDT
jgi:hypothetical protein